ncbi:MAG: TonB-dependent receptor [Pseudomonadota bacterium]|nr:TonB-dependent receptor [Pseudomonadota bacterium]
MVFPTSQSGRLKQRAYDRSSIFRKKKISTLICAAIAVAAAVNVNAQSAAEEITVTGTRIRGIAPAGAPTIELGRTNMDASTASTVADMLKEVPQIISQGIDETSFTSTGVAASNVSRASAINLRGLSPVATLVLLNGHRVVPSGTAGAFVDSSNIPAIALQRVEVVADGSSAIYGSDAVAGVVNLILRNDYEGAETSVRLYNADSYQRTQVSQLLGRNWDGGNAMLAYEYSQNDPLNSRERDFYRQDQRPRGGDDYRDRRCSPGTMIIGTQTYAIPAGGGSRPSPESLVPGTQNLCDMSSTDIIPEQERHSAVFFASQDVTDRFSISAEGIYSRKAFEAHFVAQGSASSLATLQVPSTNAFFVAPAGTSPTRVAVDHSFYEEYGLLSADGESETWSTTIEGTFDLTENWRMQASGSWGRNEDFTFSRRISQSALSAALASSDPNTALNPFGPGTNPAVLDAIFSEQFTPGGVNKMSGGDIRADGTLFELPGGTVGLAVGTEFRRYELETTATLGPIVAPRVDLNSGNREVVSAYAEVLIPLVGSANAREGIQRLDVSLAARYDEYDDFGSTSNPKVGITWEPFDGLSVRASYGTSFRAPALSDLRAPGEANIFGTADDPLSPTGRSNGLTIRGGNPNLKPEEAETRTLGFEWVPASLPDMSLDVSYFSIDYEEQLGSAFGAPVLQDPIYAAYLVRNPTEAQVQEVLNNGRPLTGAILTFPIDYIIDARTVNRGATSTSGFDVQVGYNWETANLGRFNLSVNGTYFGTYETQLTPAAPITERVGTIGYPFSFRARANLRWSLDNVSAGGIVNYFDSYKDIRGNRNDTVSAFATFDVFANYDIVDWGVTLSLNVANVFDEEPPFVNSTSGYDPGNASPYGRMVMLGVSKSFE